MYFPPGAVSELPPGYSYTVPPYGAAPYAPPPVYAVQPPPPRPAPPPVRVAQAPAPKPPIIRAQAADDPPPARLTPVAMPSPDQLGVPARTASGNGDWSAVHQRLQELGVLSFQVDRLNEGVYQFTCLLPTAEAGKTHRIEAHGSTEAEAVRCALDEAQRWKSQK